MTKTGALIIASSDFREENRDNEEIPVFLPMHPLDGTTVIKREIAALRRAAVSPVLVLLGYQKDLLKNHLSHNKVMFVEDDRYEEHDLPASVELGLREAGKHMERAVVIPVEYPAFARETLETLLRRPAGAVPVCQGREGYPRLYAFGAQEPERCPVEDPGCVLSVRTEDGIRQAEAYVQKQRDANELRCRNRLILSKEEDFFNPEVYRLLRLIDETGSIQAAALKMDISYTKGWMMVNRLEKEMGFLFLNRCNGGRNGGSSTITGEGRIFMERYHAMEEDMRRISRRFFDTYFQDFQ